VVHSEGAEDGAPVFVPVKTEAGRRSIKLDDVTLAVLRAHREAQEFERRSWGDGYHDHDLVFCRPDGAAHDPDTISGQFERLNRQSKLKRIRFHDLRHTHATLLLEAGVDITVVSRRLGHANVKITAERYAHVTARLQYDAAERFSALVDGKRDPVVIPLPETADSGHTEPESLSSETGSGARIRTVNLAVNSTGGRPIGTAGNEFAQFRWVVLRVAASTLFGVRSGVRLGTGSMAAFKRCRSVTTRTGSDMECRSPAGIGVRPLRCLRRAGT
jgi:Phage integrase family